MNALYRALPLTSNLLPLTCHFVLLSADLNSLPIIASLYRFETRPSIKVALPANLPASTLPEEGSCTFRITRRDSQWGVVAGLSFVSCSDKAVTPPFLEAPSQVAASHDFDDSGLRFTGALLLVCLHGLGRRRGQSVLASSRLTQSIIVSEPRSRRRNRYEHPERERGAMRDAICTGRPRAPIGEISVTDLKHLGPNSTKRFAFRADWESMDPTVWTPWGTILVAEEVNPRRQTRSGLPGSQGGTRLRALPEQARSLGERPNRRASRDRLKGARRNALRQGWEPVQHQRAQSGLHLQVHARQKG